MASDASNAEGIKNQIDAQGQKVRELKTGGGAKVGANLQSYSII